MNRERFSEDTAKVLTGISKGSGEATEVIGLILRDMLRKVFRMIGLVGS
jgi:hypothetical protein